MLSLLLAGVVAATQPNAFALIITSNHGAETNLPDLRYADDDAGNYAQLFGELLGNENVTLLTSFDPESLPRHKTWSARAQRATRNTVQKAASELAARVKAASTGGEAPEVYVVLAGHDDLEHGQGYLSLEDGRMTARELESWVVAPLMAKRVHLILDSCNSYFMLNPRGAAARWEAPKNPEPGLLEKYPHVGAVFSTSAEAVTYEWSELQSGIFSYLVRSGLRGGADADQNGVVSYTELVAFIELASRDVVNDLYRPKIFSQAPMQDGTTAFLRLQQQAQRTLTIPAPAARRVTLRDQDGVRVLDVHVEAGAGMTLNVPTQATTLLAYETFNDATHSAVARELDDGQNVLLDDVAPESPALAARGESPVFRALFQSAYGPKALATHLAARPTDVEKPTGITARDAERLQLHLEAAAAFERDSRLIAGLTFSTLGVALLGGGIYSYVQSRSASVPSNDQSGLRVLGATYMGLGAGLSIAGALALFVPGDLESLAGTFAAGDTSTETARAKLVSDTEHQMLELVDEWTFQRKFGGIVALVVGTAVTVPSVIYLASDQRPEDKTVVAGLGLGLGAMTLAVGVYQLTEHRYPVERTWDLYLGKTKDGVTVLELSQRGSLPSKHSDCGAKTGSVPSFYTAKVHF